MVASNGLFHYYNYAMCCRVPRTPAELTMVVRLLGAVAVDFRTK
jgi:hypothetical protein